MWTKQNRSHYDRSKLRYPSDLTRRGVAANRTADLAGQARRQQADGGDARSRQWPVVRYIDGLSVARDPERPAAEKHSLRIFRSMDL